MSTKNTKNILGKTRKFSIYMLTLLLLAGCDDTAKHKGIPKSVFHIKQKDIESQAFTNASEQSIVYIVDKFEKDGELVYDSHQPEGQRIVNPKIWDECEIEWGLRKKGTSKIYLWNKEQVTEGNKAEFTVPDTMPPDVPKTKLDLETIHKIEIDAKLTLPNVPPIENDKTDKNLLPMEIVQQLIDKTPEVEATDKGDDKGQKGRMGTTGESSATSTITTTATEEGEYEDTLKSKFKETFSKYYEKENQVLSLGQKAEEQGDDVLYALSFGEIDSSTVNRYRHLYLKTKLWKSEVNGQFKEMTDLEHKLKHKFSISLGIKNPEKLVLRVKDIDKIDGLKSFFTDKTYRVEKIDNKVTFTSTKEGKNCRHSLPRNRAR